MFHCVGGLAMREVSRLLARGLFGGRTTRAAALGGASPAASTDLSHMPPVQADLFSTFATRRSCFVGGKLVRLPFFMGGSTPLASNFTLAMGIHRGKAPIDGTDIGFRIHFSDSLQRSETTSSGATERRRNASST
jgi:hypothetical protein